MTTRIKPQPQPEGPTDGRDSGSDGADPIGPSSGVADRVLVSAETPIRSIGDVPLAVWSRVFAEVESPIPQAEWRGCYESSTPHSAAPLATAVKETEVGKTAPAGTRNALGIGPGRAFSTWAEGFADFRRRLTGVQPPYTPENISVRTFYEVYVGGPFCPGLLAEGKVCANGEDAASIGLYIRQFVERVNGWLGTVTPPTPGYNFGPHPFPRDYERRILTLPPNGKGWNNLGNRSVGMCATFFHHTAGRDNRESVFDLFSPGGGRFGQAMTEGVIDRTGKGIEMLDPWSAIGKEGSIVPPWASGPATSLKGPGIPFVQQLGANAVNKRSYAVEHCNVSGQGFTDAQMDMSAKVYAVVISREKIPWDVWPRNPNVNGLYVAMQHRDVAPTSCPGSDWTRGAHEAWVAAVGLEAKALQGGGGTLPPPPPLPTWPVGYSREEVAGFWAAQGGLKKRMPDGTITVYPFDDKGPISAMWLQRARETGYFPAALHWQVDQTGWNFVTFGDADDTDWILGIGSLESRADWRWLDVAP